MRATAAKITQQHARFVRKGTYVAVRSCNQCVSAATGINRLDYSVYGRRRSCTHVGSAAHAMQQNSLTA